MKVILDQDRIINFSDAGIEIGTIPLGIDIRRLRWTGASLIDLNDLTEIWVEYKGGAFILHAIEVPGSQLVTMTYANRKDLKLDVNTIRLKTSDERYNESLISFQEKATARLYSRLRIPPLFFRFIFELLYIITKGLKDGGTNYVNFITQFLADVGSVVDDPNLLDSLPDQAKKFAELTQLYYSHVSSSSCSSSKSSSSSSKSSSSSSSSCFSATPDFLMDWAVNKWTDTIDDWWTKSSSSSSRSSSSCSRSSSSSSRSSSCSCSSSRSSSSSCCSSSSSSRSSSSSCCSSCSSSSSSMSSSSSSLSSSSSCSSSSSRSSSSSSKSSSCSSSSSLSLSSSSRSSSSSCRSSSCSSSSSAWIFVPL